MCGKSSIRILIGRCVGKVLTPLHGKLHNIRDVAESEYETGTTPHPRSMASGKGVLPTK